MNQPSPPSHPAENSPGLWSEVQDSQSAAPRDPASREGLWQTLKAKIDFAQSRPARAEHVSAYPLQDRTGLYYVLKNPAARTYLRLAPREFWLWERMDGTQSVQELVVAYFLQYKTFAFGLIAGLVGQLGLKQMLRDKPQFVFFEARRALTESTLGYKLAWPARVLLTRQWVIRGLDGWLTGLHHSVGWLFYTLPAQIIYLLISVIGLYLFTRILGDPRFKFGGDGLGQSVALLWLAAILPIVIHELAHALTTKHYGCEVHQGGLMLYFGMPAAFVDTTDIWTRGKRARLAVTWAGPYTGLIIGGLCSIAVWLWPAQPSTPFLFQMASVGVFVTVMNLNPLLKLDGYYLLSDALEIAQLRERSLAFLRHTLLPKIIRREKTWTRDEIIFVIFGVLSGAWTVYIIYVSLIVWNQRVANSVQAILRQPGNVGALALNGALILLAVSFLALIGFQLYGMARAAVGWLRRTKWLATPGRAALAVGLLSAGVVSGPRLAAPGLAPLTDVALGAMACGAGAWLALAVARDMRGSRSALAWPAMAGALALIGSASIVHALPLTGGSALGNPLEVAGLTLGALALLLAGRLLVGLRGSWRQASALMGGLGWAVLAAQFSVGGDPGARAFGACLLLGSLLHWRAAPPPVIALESISVTPPTTRDQLWAAFALLARSALGQLRLAYGRGAASRAEARFNSRATERDWGFGFVAEQLPATPPTSSDEMTSADLAEVLAVALTGLLDDVARVAGEAFARRALARAYDALDWEAREIAGEHLLRQVRWAAGLAEMFHRTHDDVLSLLGRVALFIAFTAPEMEALAQRLRPESFGKGDDLIRQGDRGDRFYLLRRGRVEVRTRDAEGVERKVNELVSGDYFGEAALLTREPRNATIRALTPVEALSLSKRDFDRLLRAGFAGGSKLDVALKRLGLLRRIPLFADFESYELKLVAAQFAAQEVEAGEAIIRQGEAGDKFYIVEAGEVAVRLRGSDGAEAERARLGPGDYFGEIALLMDVPRVASVVAVEAARLLTLNAATFNELVRESHSVKQALERVGSRRALSNEQFMRKTL